MTKMTKRERVLAAFDHQETDPKRRYKMFTTMRPEGGGPWVLALQVSPDGIHWSQPAATSPGVGDRTTVFYNPFRKRWVYSLRIDHGGRMVLDLRRSQGVDNLGFVAGMPLHTLMLDGIKRNFDLTPVGKSATKALHLRDNSTIRSLAGHSKKG